jgi:hypothetical protein
MRRAQAEPSSAQHEPNAEQSFVPPATIKVLHSPVNANTYVENTAGQVRPLVRERLLARLWFSGAYMTLFALVRSLKRQHASQAAGFAAVTIAAAALAGWWVELPLLSSWGLSFASMKPVTALCLAALGLALMYPGKNSRLAFAVGLAVAAIAVLDLFDVDFGINRWLVPRAAVPGPGAASFDMINGMPLAIALASISVSTAGLCRGLRCRDLGRPRST